MKEVYDKLKGPPFYSEIEAEDQVPPHFSDLFIIGILYDYILQPEDGSACININQSTVLIVGVHWGLQ